MHRRAPLRVARVALVALASVVVLSACRWSGFNDLPARDAAADAVAWLETRQQSDGGFEVAGFPGFETSDAVLAVAEAAQTQYVWSTTEAEQAVRGVTAAGGDDPLDALDAFAEGGLSAGQAAKLVVLVAAPLGLDPAAFDPARDGSPVDLEAAVAAGVLPDGSYGAGVLNATLYAALAERLTAGSVPAITLAYVRSAQEASGGWDFAGDPTGADADVDTTGLAVQVLAAAGVAPTDPDLVAALGYLAAEQQPSGAWPSFGSDDPNSTSVAALAITAAGFDPATPCWRDTVAPGLAGQPYESPMSWLRSQQQPDGRIASPLDAYGVNTFPTSQTVQAMRRGWLPVVPLAPRGCAP